jgi:ketol-acid reductoisomerase
MRQVLGEIQDGTFAARWIRENETGRAEFEALRAQDRDHQIEQVGAELRAQMPFLNPVVVHAGEAQAGAGQAGARAGAGQAHAAGAGQAPAGGSR